MTEKFTRDLNRILYEKRNGLQFCDLPDDEQQAITEMEEMGFTAEEAFDVMQEVENVE